MNVELVSDASLSPGQTQEGLTTKEQTLLSSLVQENISVELTVPGDCNPEMLMESLRLCCKAANILEMRAAKLRPVIGRILLVISETPSFFLNLGYKDFKDFLARHVQGTLGLCRTNCYEAIKTAQNWPRMTPQEYSLIGPPKMAIVNRITDSTKRGHERILKAAESMTVKQFHEWVVEQNLLERGEAFRDAITIVTNAAIVQQWKSFIHSPEVHAFCGTANEGEILKLALCECISSWLPQVQQQQREESNFVKVIPVDAPESFFPWDGDQAYEPAVEPLRP